MAYVERQHHFTPPQASSTVIQVVDVLPVATYTVFPDGPNFSPPGSGAVGTWDDDLTQIHSAGEIHWSPDGSKLLFFCIHGLYTARAPSDERQPYLVLVDVRDLEHSHYTHQAIAKDLYLVNGAELPNDRRYLFRVKSIEWLDGVSAIRLIPMPDAPRMKHDLVLKLPAAGRHLIGERRERHRTHGRKRSQVNRRFAMLRCNFHIGAVLLSICLSYNLCCDSSAKSYEVRISSGRMDVHCG